MCLNFGMTLCLEALYQFYSNEVPGSKMGATRGLSFKLLKYIKNIKKSEQTRQGLAKMLQIWYVALPSGLLTSLLNQARRVQDGSAAGVLSSNHRNT